MQEGCSMHNSPIILVNQKVPLCIICIQIQMGNVQTMQEFKEIEQEIINYRQTNQFEQFNFIKHVESLKSSILLIIDQVLQFITEQIKEVPNQNQKNVAFIQECSIFKIEESVPICEKWNSEFILKFTKDFENQLECLKYKMSMEQIYEVFDSFNVEFIYDEIECKISQNSIEQSKTCLTFTFNSEITNLFVGCGSEIIIYQFENGLLQQILQRLTDHTNVVTSLQYLENSKQLISTSADCSIIIWKQFDNVWSLQQQLKGHKDWVVTQTINKEENLLVTGGYDQKIKFWEISDGKWQFLQDLNQNYQFIKQVLIKVIKHWFAAEAKNLYQQYKKWKNGLLFKKLKLMKLDQEQYL